MNLPFRPLPTKVAASKFNFFAMIQGKHLNIGFLKTGKSNYHFNSTFMTFSAVACHPNDALIATGDVQGQIQLWRHVFELECITTIYHWHSTPVNTIAFSESGTTFYSGAREFVLVKWAVERQDLKQFLPRIRGAPVHVAVGPRNNRVAMSLSDNEIQLLNTNLDLSALIQNFTYVHDDETGLDKFPCGLKLNPRNNSLVLNGRPGQLQFFSTYTKTLLYNVSAGF